MQRVADTVLGDVTCNDGRWAALVHYDGRPVRVHLMVDDGEDPAGWIGLARSVVERLSVLVPAALSYAGDELLELANDWRESDASPTLSANDLSSMFKLRALLVFSGGATELCFDDANVFAGHTVIVDLGPGDRFDNARFEG